jgi:hypothetical protein
MVVKRLHEVDFALQRFGLFLSVEVLLAISPTFGMQAIQRRTVRISLHPQGVKSMGFG